MRTVILWLILGLGLTGITHNIFDSIEKSISAGLVIGLFAAILLNILSELKKINSK